MVDVNILIKRDETKYSSVYHKAEVHIQEPFFEI